MTARTAVGRNRRRSAGALALAGSLLFGACATGERPTLAAVTVKVDAPADASDPDGAVDGAAALAAVVGTTVELFAAADLAGDPTETSTKLAGSTLGGSTRTVVVTDRTDDAVQILTANGEQGWLAAEAVELVVLDTSITIDVSDATMTVVRDGEASTVSVTLGDGVADLVGETVFVAGLLSLPDDAETPWGDLLYVLAGSTVEQTNLVSGDGVRAIHATQAESAAPSLGISLAPAVFAELTNAGVALGTPVTVVASN